MTDNEQTPDVYHDAATGRFAMLQRLDGQTVALTDVETGEEYEERAIPPTDDPVNYDLFSVPREAVEDPVDYMRTFLSHELEGIVDNGFRYADRMTEIVHIDDVARHPDAEADEDGQ